MRSTTTALVLAATLTAACAHERAPGDSPPVSKVASAYQPTGVKKVFRGAEGETASLVFLAPIDDHRLLIRFDGTNTAYDGKVLLHVARSIPDKDDYIAQIQGGDYVTITQRFGSYEIHLPGRQNSIRAAYAEEDSRKLDPAAVVAAYEQQGGEPK
jgi:hypothetical protein